MKLLHIVSVAILIGGIALAIYLYKKKKETFVVPEERKNTISQTKTYVSCGVCVRSKSNPNVFSKECKTSTGQIEEVACSQCYQYETTGAWSCSS